MMGFLIRSAFWLSLVLLVLPLGGGDGTDGAEPVGPLQALSAAREAVGDLSGICERKPDVCVTGKAAFQTIGIRAREASKLAFTVLDEQFGEPDRATTTGTVGASDKDADDIAAAIQAAGATTTAN